MWGSELIKIARDFLKSKHRDYVPSARIGKACASEVSVQSVCKVVTSNARP
jgi:hypothetical protein